MLKGSVTRFTTCSKVFLSILLVASMLFGLVPLGNSITAKADTTYPEWNASTAYPSGSMVTYDGAVWKSRWYNVNEPPADVQGNAWECIIPKPLDPPAPPENPNGYDVPKVFFDDFNMYNTSSDQSLLDFGYEVSDRTGGPGPGGCIWKKENVTFVADPVKPGNKFLRLTATTKGSGETTTQAELMAPKEFLYGTYAARIKFSNTPAYGPDGDQIVETFYTISPWTLQNSPDYGEMDFEYLANGGWGKPAMTMWNTTWETASIRDTKPTTRDFEGWHTCVIQATSTEVKYYLDGSLLATHSGIYPPETDMFLSFNLWFIDGVWAGGNEQRAYVQDVDWVYYSRDKIMVPAQTECNVEYYRRNLVSRKDSIKNPVVTPSLQAAVTSVDNANNTGNYTVTVSVPAGNTANNMKLYEGSTVVLDRALTVNSSSVQTFTYAVANKPVGSYAYRADVRDAANSMQGNSITVTVSPVSNPTLKAASISVDNANNSGNYTVTVTVPANNTATTMKLYEGSAVVLNRTLTVNSSSAQTFTYPVTNKVSGTYIYRADVNDASNTLQSSNLTVTVATNPKPGAASISVDNANNTGSYTITVTVPAGNTATQMDLFEGTAKVLTRTVIPNSSTVQTFTYPVTGKPAGTYVYRADLTNANGTTPGTNLSVTVSSGGGTVNVASGKSITSSIGPIANGSVVTDGDKTTYNLAGVGEGLQWIQIDLGQSYNINKINMWHYFGDGRTYRDVIVRVSNTADFSSGVTTVYNNDGNNSAGFGTGTDTEYVESSAGKTVNFNAVNARYVRLYINGNSVNPYNHFVEVEVWKS